jgi:hypothetical protein
MTNEQIEQLNASWDLESGFFGNLRERKFNNELFENFVLLLRSISFNEDELIPRRVVSLLWYIPLFMEWQKERVRNTISLSNYENKKTEIENELERILGVP